MQMQICKSLLDANKRLCKAKINDDEVIITIDGFSAFVFFEKECIFDLSKIPNRESLRFCALTDETYERIFVTKQRFVNGNAMIAKLENEKCIVYVDEKFIKTFDKYDLFAKGAEKPVIAKDKFGNTVGLFCAFRFHEE